MAMLHHTSKVMSRCELLQTSGRIIGHLNWTKVHPIQIPLATTVNGLIINVMEAWERYKARMLEY
jgi:hypothetical protein